MLDKVLHGTVRNSAAQTVPKWGYPSMYIFFKKSYSHDSSS